jgi:beta-lactamase class A
MKFSYQTGASGSRLRYESGYSSAATTKYWVVALLLCGMLILPVAVSFRKVMPKREAASTVSTPQVASVSPSVAPAPVETDFVSSGKVFSAELQTWLKKRSGQYGVYVGGTDGNTYAEAQADRVFSSESIYKLYVAYLGYQQMDTGTVQPSQLYSAGRTRLQCLDLMIRVSDSPCAEKLLSELGKPAVDVKLKAYGLSNTSVRSMRTTARDAAKVLELIQKGADLSADSRTRLLESLKNQKYRNGLPKGFAGSTAYNKVGFRDLVQYNDVALVTLADGRVITVAVMTENAGVKNIARLGAEINRLLQQ